jgi:hypothetical protein
MKLMRQGTFLIPRRADYLTSHLVVIDFRQGRISTTENSQAKALIGPVLGLATITPGKRRLRRRSAQRLDCEIPVAMPTYRDYS